MRQMARTMSVLLAVTLSLCGLRGIEAQDVKDLKVRPIADAPSFAKRALVIGIGEYEHARSLAPSTYNDARSFAQLLKTHFKFDDNAITLMTDAPGAPEKLRPTYLRILNAIDTLLAGINSKSEVVVYFSGHGIRTQDQDWLMPLDGLPNNVTKSCISYDEFKSRLTTKLPARALLIIDACRNLQDGKDAGSSGFGAGKGLSAPQFAEMLSCRPKEISQLGKPEDFSESVFTHFLLQGLKGDPEAQDMGLVTFDSLNQFVQGKVSQYVSSKFGTPQNPDGRASLGKMVLARGAIPPSPDDPPAKLNALLRVETNPSGATIRLNGADTGRVTPADITVPLTAREQTFKLELFLEGYDRFTKEDLTLEVGKRAKVQERLQKSTPIPSADNKLEEIERKTGLKFVSIPSGSFDMGGDKYDFEKPIHRVELDGFYMSKNVVTVGQYEAYCKATGKAMPPEPDYAGNKFNAGWGKKDHPIVNVSWNDAKGYCAWAGVDLPTEAEWEYGARGGLSGKAYPWGDVFDRRKLRCSDKEFGDSGGTSSVGSYPANGYGLYDMAGNVWQWCSDWYGANYYKSSPTRNPQGSASGTGRVLRGGSWNYFTPDNFLCALRYGNIPDLRNGSDGFRVVFRGLP